MILYTFQLTCFLALGHSCVNLRVRQMSESVHVKEGASVNLSCTCTLSSQNATGTQMAVSVEWYRTSIIVAYERYYISEGQEFTVILPFHAVQRNESGKYFCNVTIIIPCVVRGSGSGTSLTVEVLTSPGKVSETSLAVVWTSLLAAVLAVGIGCAIYCKRKGNIRTATTGQETDCPTPDHSDVLYAKVNVKNSSTHDRSNSGQAQYCNKPQVGKKTLDSGCLRPAVEQCVLYSTLKSAAPNL